MILNIYLITRQTRIRFKIEAKADDPEFRRGERTDRMAYYWCRIAITRVHFIIIHTQIIS